MPEVTQEDGLVDLSVMLPAYNEQEAVSRVINEIRESLKTWDGNWEIIVIDDASQDETVERAKAEGVQVISRVENGGAGAACKTGMQHARGALLAMLDADGSYVPEEFPKLLSFFPGYDQVNGARQSECGTYKYIRFAAKWFIRKLAEWISGKKIPDLNTGMKIFKRELMLQYLWVIPDGFSNVTSMTLAFLCNGHPVKYVSVDYRVRIGKSKFHPIKDTAQYILTVFRIVMYFRPMRVFFPLSVGIGLIAFVKGSYNLARSPLGLTDSDIILAMTSLLILVVGMLAELIVAQRRGIR